MKRFLVLTLFSLICAPVCLAQSDDYRKWELYGGYSLARIESNVNSASFTSPGGTQTFSDLCSSATGDMIGPTFQKFFCSRRNMNGFDASITYNVSKYVGVKGDFTAHFKNSTFVDQFTPPGVTQTIRNRERLYNFLGGVQVKNNDNETRVKPFAHALAGVARYTNHQEQVLDLFPQFNFVIEDRVTSFALKLGGGLDVRVSRRVDIRVFEVDYNPVFTGDRSPRIISGPFTVAFDGRTSHNLTFSAGIVIH